MQNKKIKTYRFPGLNNNFNEMCKSLLYGENISQLNKDPLVYIYNSSTAPAYIILTYINEYINLNVYVYDDSEQCEDTVKKIFEIFDDNSLIVELKSYIPEIIEKSDIILKDYHFNKLLSSKTSTRLIYSPNYYIQDIIKFKSILLDMKNSVFLIKPIKNISNKDIIPDLSNLPKDIIIWNSTLPNNIDKYTLLESNYFVFTDKKKISILYVIIFNYGINYSIYLEFKSIFSITQSIIENFEIVIKRNIESYIISLLKISHSSIFHYPPKMLFDLLNNSSSYRPRREELTIPLWYCYKILEKKRDKENIILLLSTEDNIKWIIQNKKDNPLEQDNEIIRNNILYPIHLTGKFTIWYYSSSKKYFYIISSGVVLSYFSIEIPTERAIKYKFQSFLGNQYIENFEKNVVFSLFKMNIPYDPYSFMTQYKPNLLYNTSYSYPLDTKSRDNDYICILFDDKKQSIKKMEEILKIKKNYKSYLKLLVFNNIF